MSRVDPAINPQSYQQNSWPVGYSDTGAVLAEVQKFLGPPRQQIPPSPLSRVSFTHHDLPEAYEGRNAFLRDRITGLIIRRQDAWYTTDLCMPWRYSDDLHVQFNIWHFERTIAPRQAYQAPPRYVRSRKSTFMESQVRRGLAFVLESDFFATPEGRRTYELNIMNIAQSVQETQDYDTMNALLTCKNYYKIWEEAFGKWSPQIYSKVLDREVEDFGAIQRPGDGHKMLEILVDKHSRLMQHESYVAPTLLILWPEASQFINTTSEKATEYMYRGPDDNQATDFSTKAIMMKNGVTIVQTRDFNIYDDSPPIQPLARVIKISEHTHMLATHFRQMAELYDFETRLRDIWMYNETNDVYELVPFREAFINANLFNMHTGEYEDSLRSYVAEMAPDTSSSMMHSRGMFANDPQSAMYYKHLGGNTQMEPFFLASRTIAGEWALINYFGQMDSSAASDKDFRQIAQSIVGKLGCTQQDVSAIDSMVQLLKNIESQDYVHRYWELVVAANRNYSVDAAGNFIGEMTPSDLSAHPIREWTPNAHGSLRLPTDNGGSKYPSGFNNAPGMRTLADEANTGSSWAPWGKVAAAGIEALDRIARQMNRLLPKSELLDPANRAPWFHVSDVLTTFFQLIAANRDPIFLGHPDLEGGGSARETRESEGIPWRREPARKAQFGGGGESLTYKSVPSSGTMTYFSLDQGGEVTVDVASIKAPFLNTPEILAIERLDRERIDLVSKINASILADSKTHTAFVKALATLSATRIRSEQLHATIEGLFEDWANFVQAGQIEEAKKLIQKFSDDKGRKELFKKYSNRKVVVGELPFADKFEALRKGSISGYIGQEEEGESPILEESFGGLSNQFYRCPLTMSFALLKSLGSHLPEAMIRPGNPETGFLTPVIIAGKSASDLPSRLWQREEYANINDKSSNVRVLSFVANREIANLARQHVETRYDEPEHRDVIGDHLGKERLTRQKLTTGARARSAPALNLAGEDEAAYVDLLRPCFLDRYKAASALPNLLERLAAMAFLTTRCDNGHDWLHLIEHDVHVPISFILWRLDIEHKMNSAILMVGGESTGVNLYGHSNFQFGADTIAKMLVGHFTFHSKAVVTEQRHVHILENVKWDGYRGGSNCTFLTLNDRDHVGRVEDEVNTNRPSIVSTAVPISFDNKDLSRVMSFVGKTVLPLNQGDKVTYPTAEYYDRIWRISEKTVHPDIGNMRFYERTNFFTTHSFQGLQGQIDPSTKQVKWTRAAGFRKDACGEGALAVCNGHGMHKQYVYPNIL